MLTKHFAFAFALLLATVSITTARPQGGGDSDDDSNWVPGSGGGSTSTGSGSTGSTSPPATSPAPQLQAIAILKPTTGNTAEGTVVFTQVSSTIVEITVSLTGVSSGAHGIHIHAFGDISDPAGLASGLHYNPTNREHRCPTGDGARYGGHVGDIGNITADASGTVKTTVRVSHMSLLQQSPFFIVGRAIIVHSAFDDCIVCISH
ncbi:superoxide dismutase [Cladochytrium replicatum]|nr:superoxide dismutase [Cladochytrium replicatum]